MKRMYAVRTVSPTGHNAPCYLQKSEYGLQFTYRASYACEIHYFSSKEDAIEYMEENFSNVWFEIVEVYMNEKE